MALSEITDRLTTLGVEHCVLPSGVDGAVLLLPDYGRVFGIWANRRAENALWVSPEFMRRLAVGVKDDVWANPGGDRMWLGPREEFLQDGSDVPSSIDPGHFKGATEKGGYAMENKGEARAWRAGIPVRFKLVRRVRAMDEARLEETWGKTWLRRAGYEEETFLEVKREAPRCIRLWNLTQARAGAEVLIPLRRNWQDTVLSSLPPGVPLVENACAVLGRRGTPGGSLGFPASDARPRILCIEEGEPGHSQLLVKELQPPEETESAEPLLECRWGGRDGSVEFSCVSPAAGRKSRLRWKTSLCVFSGRTEEIRTFAKRIASAAAEQ